MTTLLQINGIFDDRSVILVPTLLIVNEDILTTLLLINGDMSTDCHQ